MSNWSVDVDDHGLERRLQRLELFLRDLRSFWPKVVPLFTGWIRQQFTTEGAFGGRPWVPLAYEYGIWKQAHFPGKTILIREGALRRAASNPIRRVTPTTLTLSIESPTVEFHQRGGPSLPARPLIFAQLPLQARAELDAAAESYIRDLLGRLG